MRTALGCPAALLFVGAFTTPAPAAELPARYFRLMEAELARLRPDAEPTPDNGAMLAAAVLYTKRHPANPAFADRAKLELALKLGDLAASAAAKDAAENKQDYEWEIHFWLDTYRLLEPELGAERRARWRAELEKIVRWFAREVAGRIDVPRYQGPFIRTSTNHLALFASAVYLAGRVLPNPEWEALGARALHRLAAEEQTADGYWGEFTDNGPATGYNYLTSCCVALYWEHGHDPAAREALRRATDFHTHFTWPDGTPVETINGRNRHGTVSPWGAFRLHPLARRPPVRGVPRRVLRGRECERPRPGPPRAECPVLSRGADRPDPARPPALRVSDEGARRHPQNRPLDGLPLRPDRRAR